ncbi:hypothetical protein HMPREF9943_00045 [Eggerthia catenaformis OT 569 = DSM 20559]|uniref:Uncharacterized protein n=1 Tax=Eggerthia catenaformis OT 569 = DSM 20559 TaxID=999415 RepID=M2NHA9_9FIRM|nr:hypothetical protein [Eggerthia catenaformis]EMD17613.1 hypothetical protein HMPREF9943_00045 [Eggerthia catenaformis OT 569 = DSM 20559]
MSNLITLDMRKKLKNNNKNWFITTQVIDEFTDDEQTTIILIDPQIKYELNSIKNKVANKIRLFVHRIEIFLLHLMVKK